MLLPYYTRKHVASYTIVYHYFTPAFMFNWGPSGPSTAATAMASATPKLPTLPPVAVSMVNSLFWDTIWGSSWLYFSGFQISCSLYWRLDDWMSLDVGKCFSVNAELPQQGRNDERRRSWRCLSSAGGNDCPLLSKGCPGPWMRWKRWSRWALSFVMDPLSKRY